MKLKYRKQFFRAVSLLLIIALLCPLSLNTVVISANAAENVTEETTAVKEEAITETASLGDTLEVPGFVSQAQIEEHGHISRLSDEETLNTLVYLNRDGTKTKYIMDYPVKYIDENGNTKFVDLSLGETTTSFETTANDIVLSVSKDYTKGITLTYKDYLVSLVAVPNNNRTGSGSISTAPITIATKNNNVITYNDVFDTDIDVRYSPLHNGVKEDIVLETYTGINTFDFVLHTGGLGVYSENGDYYIAASEDAEMRMEIGKTIAYDAARRFSVGTLMVTPIKENLMYQLTITVDETFLADANTVYPVLIDPSITVSDTTHGAGAVTDSPVYSGMPTFNMGTALYNPIGYLDSTYQIGRTAVKLTGLINDSTYQNLLISEIQSVNFYIKDSSGTPAKAINLYALTSNSTWTENSLTWNTVGTISPTLQASANVGGGAWSSFNITNLVKGWKAGTYTASCGFILQSSNESVTGNFFSSESAESNWPYLVLTYEYAPDTGGGNSFATAKTIGFGDVETVDTVIANEKRYFKFTPTETAEYVIMSNNYTGDPKVWLYTSGGSSITSQDDVSYPSNKNFWLKYTLQANTTYYIGAGHAGSNLGGYYFMILKSANLANGFYHIRNHYSTKRLDICGPGEQIYVHQWTAHTGEQEKWLIQGHVENGEIAYYTIRSQYGDNKYIGISSTNTGEDNIRLFDDIGNNTKWNIYSTPSGSYFLEPTTAKGRGIYAADTGTGTKMQLSWAIPVSTKTKWFMDNYTYSDVNLTFSAFDVGDSSEDEVAIVKQWMEGFGYTDIGTYNNADKKVLAESIKDIGRYSDVVYINGHGGRYANMKVKYGAEYDINGDGQPDDESNIISYLCADDSVNPGNNISRIGIGADWITGSTTKTESYWDRGTKWGIIAQCAQLDYSTNAPDAKKHWKDTYYSAQVWARTMLGVSERIHGYVGYYNVAPGGSTHTTRLTNFFSRVNEDNYIVNAWAQAHTALLGSSDWAAIYHSANATDSFQSMTASTQAGSAYTIYYVARDASVRVLPLNNTSGNLELTDSLLQNNTVAMPLFTNNASTEGNALSTEALYNKLYNLLQPTDNSILNVEDNGRVTYIAGNKDWGGSLQRCTLSNSEAVSIAEQQLAAMGLLPTDDYNVTVSKIQRQKLNLNGEMVYLPETIQYVVSFYRTHNGVEVLSDQEDGIIVCVDGSGLTELRYLWRKMDTVTCSQMNTSEVISIEQAQAAYQAALDAEKQIIAMNDTSSFVKTVYLQIGNEVRPVYSFSTDEGYANCIFVDMLTGEVINLS